MWFSEIRRRLFSVRRATLTAPASSRDYPAEPPRRWHQYLKADDFDDFVRPRRIGTSRLRGRRDVSRTSLCCAQLAAVKILSSRFPRLRFVGRGRGHRSTALRLGAPRVNESIYREYGCVQYESIDEHAGFVLSTVVLSLHRVFLLEHCPQYVPVIILSESERFSDAIDGFRMRNIALSLEYCSMVNESRRVIVETGCDKLAMSRHSRWIATILSSIRVSFRLPGVETDCTLVSDFLHRRASR